VPTERLWKLAAVSVVIVAGMVWARLARLARARDDARAAAGLVRDSLAAAADTTRVLHLHLAALGESLTVVQRRAVQTGQRADGLDRALGAERVARVRLTAQVVALARTVRSDSAGSDGSSGERAAVFDVRDAPYSVHAEVRLPPPPAVGTMAVLVQVDTLALELRISCGETDRGGVRPAMATVVGPAWAAVQLQRVEQAAEVCATSTRGRDAARGLAAVRRWMAERVGVSVGLGVTRDARGVLVAGPGAVVGVRAWP